MEKIDRSTLELMEDRFFYAYMTQLEYSKIPSTEGIRFYEILPFDIPRKDYTVMYARTKFDHVIKKDIPEDESFELEACSGMYPDFYMRNSDILEEINNGYGD